MQAIRIAAPRVISLVVLAWCALVPIGVVLIGSFASRWFWPSLLWSSSSFELCRAPASVWERWANWHAPCSYSREPSIDSTVTR